MTPLLSVADVAKLLSVSQSLVYRLAADGELRCYRIGRGALRFSEDDVERYLFIHAFGGELQGKRAARKPSVPHLKHINL